MALKTQKKLNLTQRIDMCHICCLKHKTCISLKFIAIKSIHNTCTFYSVSGLSPDLQSMEQIRRIMRPTDVPDTGILHQHTL